MANASGISFAISATDTNATKTLDAINKQIDALSKPVRDLQTSMEQWTQAGASGLHSLGRNFEQVAGSIGKATAQAAKFAPALGAITSIASAAGFARMMSDWTTAGATLELTAQRIGMPVQRLNELQNASRLAGSSAEEMTASLASLQGTMQDSVYGRNPEAQNIFRNLIGDIGNFRTGARSALDILPKIAEQTKALYDRDPTHQAAQRFLDLIGVGRQMLPVYKDGAAGLQSYLAEAQRYGTITQQQADAAAALRVEQTKLALAFEHLGYDIAAAMGPDLGIIIHEISTLVHDSTPDIIALFKEGARYLHEFLQPDSLAAFNQGLKDIAFSIRQVWEAFEKSGLSGVVWELVTGGLTAPPHPVPGGPPQLPPATGLTGMVTRMFGYPDPRDLPGETYWEHLRRTLLGPISPSPSTPASPLPAGAVVPFIHEAPGSNPNDPRGVRMNNPGNVSFHGNEPGLIGRDHGPENEEAAYSSMRAGVAASMRNLLDYQDRRHLNTIEDIVSTWAPPATNPTAEYIADIHRGLAAQGRDIAPGVPVNVRQNSEAAFGLLDRMFRFENGRAVDPAVIRQGIADALGGQPPVGPALPPAAPPAPAAYAPTGPSADDVLHRLRHEVTVRIDNHNPPAGQVITVDPSTIGVVYPPRQEMPMRGP